MNFSETDLLNWLQTACLVFARCGGVVMTAPVFGARPVPPRVRVALAILSTVLLLPLLPEVPTRILGTLWWLALAQQVLIGAAMGFVLQLVFEAVALAGELIAYGMGLSFAQLSDPLRGAGTPVVGQFLMILATLLFLGLDGHLVLLQGMAGSFRTLPPSAGGFSPDVFWGIAIWGGQMFAGAIRIAVPLMVAMLVINLSFGVLSRAAPSLNLLAVGFPISLLAGMVLLQFGLPGLQLVFSDLLNDAWQLTASITAPPR
ncbi:MAG: flagellar biosynthetic protein FliR [Panacagrimonas sp.]